MTTLQILNLLKSTRDSADPAIVWLNEARREAAVHPGGGEACCIPVAYNEARCAITDPALFRVSDVDGETYAA